MIHLRLLVTGFAVIAAVGCQGPGTPETEGAHGSSPAQAQTIDERSYRLGSIGAFAEMVGRGVKELALSAAMPTAEMDALVEEASRIAGENGAEIYRETDFLVTDLFSSELTDGLEVLLIYRGDTKDKYLSLKAEKTRLEEAGEYQGDARRDIARGMGTLLSYSEGEIEELMRGS